MTTPKQPNSTMAPAAALRDNSDGPLASTVCVTELFAIHSLFAQALAQTFEQCQASTAIVACQRSDNESLAEYLRRMETNAREARNQVATLGAALDRIKIVALNTGLEGARLGDVAGKALIAVSDELRTLTTRGQEVLAEQAATIEQVETDRQRMIALAERTQAQLEEADDRLRDAMASEQSCQQALARLAALLQQSTGLDVETAAQLGRVSEQAKGLVDTLKVLSKPEHQGAVRAALLPALEPLLAWLSSSTESKS